MDKRLFAFIDFLTGMQRCRKIFPLFVKPGFFGGDHIMFHN